MQYLCGDNINQLAKIVIRIKDKVRRIDYKRRVAAWVLLGVFVPMLLMVSLHTHAGSSLAEETCVECLHHVHHPGHLSSTSAQIGHCVLCQLATVPFCAAATLVLSIFVAERTLRRYECLTSMVCTLPRAYAGRAPPVLL